MKKQIWKNYFDIVILPPKEVTECAIELSKQLSRHGTKWTLGRRAFIPHISLYHIPVEPKNFDAFVAEVSKTIKNFPQGYLKSTMIDSNLFMFDKPIWIQKLYLKIIKNTLKYCNWKYGISEKWHINNLPKRMQKVGISFIKKYGTPMIGTNFKPHITLASFKDNPLKLKIKKAKIFKFKPSHVYICELGPSHSCQRVVRKISF